MSVLRLLCTDLDRTLLPNGAAAETPGTRQQLANYLQQHQVQLAFVSGRDHRLVQQAIADYQLPTPDFVIADVGTTLYHCHGEQWAPVAEWHERIGPDWRFAHGQDLLAVVADIPGLQCQEPAKQGRYKLSFYTPLHWDQGRHHAEMQRRFQRQHWQVTLVYSVDEARQCGLLDVIPARAGKLAAIRFLLNQLQISDHEMLFAGDSGNDLDVLCSGLPAVLVANAAADIQAQARREAQAAGHGSRLYLAHGAVGNGHYAAGILEGIQHFFPAEDTAV